MAKDKVADPEKKEKKDKKDKKRKHADVEDAVVVDEVKKDKKDKKRKSLDGAAVPAAVEDVSMMELDGSEDKRQSAIMVEALVPFANPLCDDKSLKKVLKSVKKAAKHKALKRGVKECVKSIRKSPVSDPSALTVSATVLPTGIVVLAADISPIDVISHIPVLCEDHNIPYVYVPSRAELGAAGSTKRPTSVVMITPRAGGSRRKDGSASAADGDEEKDWDETYRDLHKLAVKMGQTVKV